MNTSFDLSIFTSGGSFFFLKIKASFEFLTIEGRMNGIILLL